MSCYLVTAAAAAADGQPGLAARTQRMAINIAGERSTKVMSEMLAKYEQADAAR